MTAPAPSNFHFIGRVWPALLNDCLQAERSALSDPRVSCFRSRHVLEKLVRHIWEFRGLGGTDGVSLFELMKDPSFTRVVPQAMLDKMHVLRRRGNDAVHGESIVLPDAAAHLLMHLFDVLSWATAQHSAHPQLRPTVPFNRTILAELPRQAQISRVQLNKLATDLEASAQELKKSNLLLDQAEQQRLAEAEAHAAERAAFEKARAEAEAAHAVEKQELERSLAAIAAERDAEIARLRAELREEQARQAGQGLPPALPPTLSEAETRRDLIDPMLARAGFTVGSNVTVEHPVEGMPVSAENRSGRGFVDYVLWDDDGTPLALIEAKKSSGNLSDGAIQAGLYAHCLERQYGRRPVVFTTTGHLVTMHEDGSTRPVEGYPTATQLRTMIHRRTHRRDLASIPVDADIAGRDYQVEVIRKVTEAFEAGRRQALLVMATGTGKTRVAIATSKLLREAGWVHKVLFLADRTALVEQAHEAFLALDQDSVPVNLLESPDATGQVYVSTYQTMMGLISDDGTTPARFTPFDFDLIIIDEAHRSIYHRFRRILDYFDAHVLGLTATPKEEVHRDTYLLFGSDEKTPTGVYTLSQAIHDKHLVPYRVFEQSSLFLRAGVRYEELSEEDKERWDAQDWGTDENGEPLDPPDGASPSEINSRLYNRDTIRRVLSTLVTRGIKVGGDQLGKTIIFARTQRHAELIKEEFDRYFPLYAGDAAQVITYSTRYASQAIKQFKRRTSGMNVAISVDMLDTGIDVPEVVNLVFFRPVYSHTKFWQMIGRGTRLCPDLFAQGVDKSEFHIFDFCGNAEFFIDGAQDHNAGGRQVTLSERLFISRAQLVSLAEPSSFRDDLTAYLHELVTSIPPDHILVRPHDRPILEHYQRESSWTTVSEGDVEKLSEHIAALPMPTMADKESAKRFDLLILQLQLGVLRADPSWEKNRLKVEKVATELLSVADTITLVGKQKDVLSCLTDSEWWEGITVEDLETARRAVRGLVEFVPKHSRSVVILDIEDEFGDVAEVTLPSDEASNLINLSKVEEQLRAVLTRHSDTIAMQKLRTARPLTSTDIAALEAMVADAGLQGVDQLRENLGGDSIPAFIRRMVGMEEAAIREEFADLLQGTTLSANQIGFVRRVVDMLARNGNLEITDLFRAPFTDFGDVVTLFGGQQAVILDLTSRLDRINSTAGAVS